MKYNLLKSNLIKLAVTTAAILLFVPQCAEAQKKNPYNLEITNSVMYYKQLVQENPDFELIDLQNYIPGIKLDIRYATKNNFTGQPIYTHPRAFMLKPAAQHLKDVQKELEGKGLGIVVWDSYRPYAGTLRFFEVCPNDTFCANPKHGSIHNRGCAIDMTLRNLRTGKYLDFGTGFDSFSDSAHHNFQGLTPEQLANRKMLKEVMEKHGFKALADEWWHYDFGDYKKYRITDLSFEELEDLENTGHKNCNHKK